MGNSASSSGRGHHDDSVDYGHLTPQGVYTGSRDWNQAIVTQLICDRKLAPFYRPLEDYDESWDEEQILAARKDIPDADGGQSEASSLRTHESASSNASKPSHHKRPSLKEPARCPDASIYRGAVECPICFLYYPPNINHSRCCDQAICTECFVQIKRTEPTTTHLVSEPAACPYCVQDNFGIVYTPPLWRAGIGSEGATPPWPDSPSLKSSQQPIESPPPFPTHKRRQKSFGHNSPEVVTTDQIRPDWEAKLAAVRAAVTRRANRRIIMRQVGDRLIPVGVTSGRVHALPTEDGQGDGTEGGGGSRRSRRRQQPNAEFNQFLRGLGGQDLEELMVMEAMRLSLLEHEEQQRREAQNKNKDKNDAEIQQGQANQSPMRAGLAVPVPSSTSTSTSTTPLTPSSLAAPGDLPRSRPETPNAEAAGGGVTSRNHSSTPRNRTPVPDPTDTQVSNNQSSNAISAALSTASTASTIIGNGDVTHATAQEKTQPESESSAPTAHNDLHVFDGSASAVTPSPRPVPLHTDSFASSITSESSESYDVLPSSPESTISHERLIEPDLEERPSTPTAAGST